MPSVRRKPEPQPPMLSPLAKWWEFELRFDRALSMREQRRLSAAIGPYNVRCMWSAYIGCDGIAPTTLESTWPGAADLRALTSACSDLPGARVRLAPLGAQHGRGCGCHPWEMADMGRYVVGDAGACGVDVTRCPWWRLVDGEWVRDGMT